MIALFGGTFDPIHVGHVAAARAAARILPVSTVRLIVAASPYHKISDGIEVTGAEHRLKMVQLACEGLPRLVADGSELGRVGASYTVELLERRREENHRERRVWVIGSDAFADVTSWYRWQEVFALTNFLVFRRRGHQAAWPAELSRWLADREVTRIDGRRHGQVMVVREDLPEVSSTAIRRLLASGGNCEHLLPLGVSTYIKNHHLYTGSRLAS